MMLDLIDKALRFAAKAHHGHFRKNDSTLPYIIHPTMTGFYLMKYDFPEHVIAAAILHDTVEDTKVRLRDIKKEFGDEIHRLVAACSENKVKSWEERKQSQLDEIRHADIDILAIKCADKLHNITDSAKDYEHLGDRVWDQLNRGKEKQKWYYKGLVSAFESRKEMNNHPMFLEFKERVEYIFA